MKYKNKLIPTIIIMTCLFPLLSGCSFTGKLAGLGTKAALKGKEALDNLKEYNEEQYALALKENDNVVDLWKNHDRRYQEDKAEQELAMYLFRGLDEGDKNLFAANFSDSTRAREDFESQLYDFIKEYPDGLSKADTQIIHMSTNRSANRGKTSTTLWTRIIYTLDDILYEVYVTYCPESYIEEEIGIIQLELNSWEAATKYISYGEDVIMVCNMLDTGAKTMRVGDNAYVYEETPERNLSSEELVKFIEETESYQELLEEIGEPNISVTKLDNINAYQYLYFLNQHTDEGKIAKIYVAEDGGYVIDCWLTDIESGHGKIIYSKEKSE